MFFLPWKRDSKLKTWQSLLSPELSEKSFCIVGNAQSLLAKNLGSFIDSHDYVIRMNHGFPINAEHQGEKTTFVALSRKIEKDDFFKYYGDARPTWMTPKRKKVPKWIAKFPRTLYYPIECWDPLYRLLDNHRPSTGAMVFNLFCDQLKIEKLSLVGFDFKKTKSVDRAQNDKGPHNWDNEEKYITGLVSQAIESGRDWCIK